MEIISTTANHSFRRYDKLLAMRNGIDKYEIIKELGKKLFADSDIVKVGKVSSRDVQIVKKFIAKAITGTNPEVLSLFFEHILIAPELGKRITEKLVVRDLKFEVSKYEVEFLLWLHEVGRLVDPGGYLRNDIIDDNLLVSFGLPKILVQKLPNVRTFLQVGKMLELSEDQLQGRANLNKEQEKIIADYFKLLTPTQRLIFIGDNFGKRDEKGELFSSQTFIQYVLTQEQRYSGDESWILDRRPAGAILTIKLVEKTIKWLKNMGVDFERILNSLKEYGLKFILMVRHGDPDNPKNIVYNLDEVMKEEDRIHITDNGRRQLKALGMVIKKRKFRVARIVCSDQIRAVESEKELNRELGVSEEQVDPRLKDLYAPGAYLEGLTMDDWKNKKGNAYDEKRWGKYKHERPEKLIDRINQVFWENVNGLKVGEAVVLLSHGDPIAWWINQQVTGQLPQTDALRDQIYPNQGQAIVCIIDPQGIFFTHYILTDPNLIEGESY
ncbi:histidine phosphatase family protein [Candidatus Roizmanbacteria bacterium]|nr:histidine phosphatase family protein [Candidatus Roizmanbacteria bacterium]